MADDKSGTSDRFAARGGHGPAEHSPSFRRGKKAKTPNAETLEALEQARTREGLTSYDTVEDMMADLDDA